MRIPLQALFERRDWFGADVPAWPLSSTSIVGGRSQAGVVVTESSAEGLPVVFACVRVIANAVAQLPCKLYKLDPGGASKTEVEASDHPLASVLDRMSNPEMTSFEFRQTMISHLLLWGNCYAKIDRNPSGQVTALWPLYPWLLSVTRDDQRRLVFSYGAEKWTYDPARPQILRLCIHSQDGIVGRSVVRVLRESIAGGIALQKFGNTFFGNGATFGGILSSPDDLDEEQRLQVRAEIDQLHQGPDRAHRFLLLYNGLKYEKLGIPPEDAQFLESKKFSRSELAGCFGVPPHMIGDLDRATFSNIENESIRWLRDGLEPYLKNFEEAVSRDLLGPRSYQQFDVRFVRNAMLRGDLKTRSEALQILRQNGIINANDWRELEELNPISAADGGDKYIITSQAKALTDTTTDPQPKARTYLRGENGLLIGSVERPISHREALQTEESWQADEARTRADLKRSLDDHARWLAASDADVQRLDAEHRQRSRDVIELRAKLRAALQENQRLERERGRVRLTDRVQ
jgi:HK97 family phage portal protein